MIVVIFLIIFSYVSVPLSNSAQDHADDIFLASQARILVNKLASFSQAVSLGGGGSKRSIETYVPCSRLICSDNVISCEILLSRPKNNPFSEQDELKNISAGLAEKVFVNSLDCNSSSLQTISAAKGWMKLVVEK